MNKLEELINEGYKVKIQSSSKFTLTLNEEAPHISFNSDSIEEAIDLAYKFVKEEKKVVHKAEVEKEITDYKIIIDVPQIEELKINEDILSGEFRTTTTIRLYTDILSQFKDFANIYKDYKFIDLVSMALLEYMEKYKK